MLKKIIYTNKYTKDLRNAKYNIHFDEELLTSLINRLAAGESLEKKYRDHKMINKKLYQGANSFHLSADLIVMYKMNSNTLTLMRIGSHSLLLGNEKGNVHFKK